MRSLFVIFIHGAPVDLKVASRVTLQDPASLTIGVYYPQKNEPIVVQGSPAIQALLSNSSAWFQDNPQDRLALFKQLFEQVQQQYAFSFDQIYFYAEGNLGTGAGKTLSPIVLELINYIQPGYALLPSGTVECDKFIHYWMSYFNYAPLELGTDFLTQYNYYQERELTPEKIAKLNKLVAKMELACAAPLFATFDKKLIPASMRYLLKIRDDRLLTPTSQNSNFEDNAVYPFDEEDFYKATSLGAGLTTPVEHAFSRVTSTEFDMVHALSPSGPVSPFDSPREPVAAASETGKKLAHHAMLSGIPELGLFRPDFPHSLPPKIEQDDEIEGAQTSTDAIPVKGQIGNEEEDDAEQDVAFKGY